MKRLIKKCIPPFVLNAYFAAWAYAGVLLYRDPSRKLKVVGVTGTNGKTSVTHVASDLLEHSGVKVASISSLRFKIGEREWTNRFKMTMPGRMHIQKFMRDAVDAGCEVLVMEVTSEGVRQKRHLGIHFDTAVFTNLTPEHIESHGSFEKYRAAKGEFFARPHRVSIINADDPEADYFVDFSAQRTITYSAEGLRLPGEHLCAEGAQASREGISFTLDGVEFSAALLGRFNISNLLAALGICQALGINAASLVGAVRALRGVPGRAEIVKSEPTVVVDYAHTPDGLTKIYEMVQSVRPSGGRTICVLGSAGGGRDKWKRPELGAIASGFCDEIILTDEDPYDEEPRAIVADIEEGMEGVAHEVIMDRRAAIAAAGG